LKKAVAKRESEKKEMADLVEQDRLLEIKGKKSYLLSFSLILMLAFG
jgi:nucleosome binding factor SPN SPT16 subunit